MAFRGEIAHKREGKQPTKLSNVFDVTVKIEINVFKEKFEDTKKGTVIEEG